MSQTLTLEEAFALVVKEVDLRVIGYRECELGAIRGLSYGYVEEMGDSGRVSWWIEAE
jgi:hypothetical protein